MRHFRRHRRRSVRREQGGALVSALFILLALLAVGVSSAYTALDAERAVRAERDHHIALQAAESALVDAERDIEGGSDPASARAALFAHGSTEGFVPGCGREGEINAGLCAHAALPAWQEVDLAAQGRDAASTEYGRFTGAVLPAGQGTLAARLPRYIIELMPYVKAGEDASRRTGNFYRITAIGFGTNEHAHVVLQTFYLKAAPEEGGA